MWVRDLHRGVLAAALSLAGIGCAGVVEADVEEVERTAAPIVFGREADGTRWPAVGALLDNANRHSVFCSATLVAKDALVGAAHCFDGIAGKAERVSVVLGASDATKTTAEQRRAVAEIIVHPGWRGFTGGDPDGLDATNDIAIVKLAAPVEDVAPIPLLSEDALDDALVSGGQVLLVGYGITNETGRGAGGRLHEGDALVRRRTPTTLLAGGEGTSDSCRYDSGGPAFADLAPMGGQPALVGITSREWARSKRKCGDGGVYTLATSFRSWIEETTGPLAIKGLPALGPSKAEPVANVGETQAAAADSSGAATDDKRGGCSVGGDSGGGAWWLGFAALAFVRTGRKRR
jgi:MYXO-CTERM domain-containing protein